MRVGKRDEERVLESSLIDPGHCILCLTFAVNGVNDERKNLIKQIVPCCNLWSLWVTCFFIISMKKRNIFVN